MQSKQASLLTAAILAMSPCSTVRASGVNPAEAASISRVAEAFTENIKIEKEDVEVFRSKVAIRGVGKLPTGDDLAPGLRDNEVCDWRIVKEGSTGRRFLVLVRDLGLTRGCDVVEVIGKDRSGFWGAAVHGSIEQDISIINANRLTIAVHRWDMIYGPEIGTGGAHCDPSSDKLYQVTTDTLVDVSRRHPEYYLPLIAHIDKSTACGRLGADIIRQTAGLDPKAGYSDALLWMHSTDEDWRYAAAEVFMLIGDSGSRAHLAEMAASNDGAASILAKNALAGVGKESRYLGLMEATQ